MKKVYLIQALCPKRHAIMAMAQETTRTNAEALRDLLVEQVDVAINRRVIDPWCGICGARRTEWIFEVGETGFTTLQEAEPELRAIELENRLTRAAIDAHKRKAGMN